MAQGLSYDSDAGRAWAGAITALMTGHAYAVSARTAARMGPFAGYHENRQPMLEVLRMHRAEVAKVDEELVPPDLLSAAQEAWDNAVETAEAYGVRNSQATVLAPTGCLVGGSLVPTARGLIRLASLGDPDGAKWQKLEVPVATDEGAKMTAEYYVNGLEPVVTVTTHRGYRLEGTPQHRVKVVDAAGRWEWKRLADMQKGDLVPLALDHLIGRPQVVPLPPLPEAYWTGEHHASAPRAMTAELAELVGYFMGDGSLHSRGLRFCVTESDIDVVERLRLLGKAVFGLEAAVAPKKGYTEVRLDSVRVVLWWEACGFAKRPPFTGHNGKGYVAHIPDAVLAANDREVYGAFLRGLYEADGDTSSGYPTLKSTSLSLAGDVQSLLLALGYPTTMTTRERTNAWGKRPLSTVRLLNLAWNEKWASEIGFMGDRKQAGVARSDLRQASRKDYIPLTRELVDRLAPTNDRLRRVLLMELARGTVSRRAATELYQRTGDGELAHLLGFFYDRVSSAELGDEQLTYDLSVPSNVTYIANGFISHNTIGLLMDCDTTGIEPDLGLVKTKKLVGGGTMSIVNQTVPRALRRLGYSEDEIGDITAYIDEHKSILGAPHLAPEHLAVFACSMGDNTIHYRGHVKMMAAAQPFISGAISKCVTGDTLVTTADGLVPIGSLYGGESPGSFRDEVLEVASLEGTSKTDAFYYGGRRPVRTVVLRSGMKVTGTPNHRLLTTGPAGLQWRRLDEISEGEYVATHYGADMWSPLPASLAKFAPSVRRGRQKDVTVPLEMTEELAFFLGVYAARGRVSERNWTVTVTAPENRLLEELQAAVRSCFGTGMATRTPGDRRPYAELASKTVVELLGHLGCGMDAATKRVPRAIMGSTRSMVLAFLRGLALEAQVTSGPVAKWAVPAASPALLDDVQSVLANLGVLTGRTASQGTKNGGEYGEVYAAGEPAQRLIALVPFWEPETQAAAVKLLNRSSSQRAQDVVPGPQLPDLVSHGAGGHGELHFSPVMSVSDAGPGSVRPLGTPQPLVRGERDRQPQHGKHARGSDRRRGRAVAHRGVAARDQGSGHLP